MVSVTFMVVITLIILCVIQILRESSFNMTRGGDEDIETRSLKF